MWKESSADARGKNGLFGVPGTRVGGLGRVKYAKLLEALDEGTMTEQLNGVPVKTRFDRFE